MPERFWGIEKDKVAAAYLGVEVKEWTITMMATDIDVSIADDVASFEDSVWETADYDDFFEHSHMTVRVPQYCMFVRMDPFDNSEEGRYGIVDFTEIFTNEPVRAA